MEEKNKYYKSIILKIIIVLLAFLGAFLGFKLAAFYMPFVIAIIVSTLVEPVIKLLIKKTKMSRKTATLITLVVLVILITLVISLLAGKIISEGKSLALNLNHYFTPLYDGAINIINEIQDGKIQISQEMVDIAQSSMKSIIDSAKDIAINSLNGIINTISSIPTMITYTFITILAIVFTCLDREYVLKQFEKHIPKKWISKTKEIIRTTCSISWNYIKAEAKLSGICFILVLIGLILFDIFGLNVEYTFLMSVFIGFVDLLPLFGAGAVMIPWAIYLAVAGNIPLAIAVACLWIAWAVIKQLIEPKMVSHQMGMHPIFTLFGMYTGFRIFGVLGLMIGPIVLLVIKNVFNGLLEKGILKSFFEME